jgi:hypothetical protein
MTNFLEIFGFKMLCLLLLWSVVCDNTSITLSRAQLLLFELKIELIDSHSGLYCFVVATITCTAVVAVKCVLRFDVQS